MIKWGGVVVTVLLVAVWIWSGCRGVVRSSPSGYRLAFARGQVGVLIPTKESDRRDIHWYWLGSPESGFHVYWWLSYPTWGSIPGVAIPVWMIAAPSMLITSLAFRIDSLARRAERRGKCFKCGYDRTGLSQSAICPECGTAPAITQSKVRPATNDTAAHG